MECNLNLYLGVIGIVVFLVTLLPSHICTD